MPQYPKYATTVIGAHSVPDWFEPLDRLLAVGQLGKSEPHRSTAKRLETTWCASPIIE